MIREGFSSNSDHFFDPMEPYSFKRQTLMHLRIFGSVQIGGDSNLRVTWCCSAVQGSRNYLLPVAFGSSGGHPIERHPTF